MYQIAVNSSDENEMLGVVIWIYKQPYMKLHQKDSGTTQVDHFGDLREHVFIMDSFSLF